MRAACLRLGQLVNQTELGRDVGLPQPTVRRYLNLLETSYLLIRLPAYAVNRTKRLIKSPKIYWGDTGVALHLSQETQPRGAHLENLVLLDLIAWRDARLDPAEIFYWRTTIGEEIDFVVETGDRLLPIEIKATTRPRLRDTTALRTFQAEYGHRSRAGLLLHTGTLTRLDHPHHPRHPLVPPHLAPVRGEPGRSLSETRVEPPASRSRVTRKTRTTSQFVVSRSGVRGRPCRTTPPVWSPVFRSGGAASVFRTRPSSSPSAHPGVRACPEPAERGRDPVATHLKSAAKPPLATNPDQTLPTPALPPVRAPPQAGQTNPAKPNPSVPAPTDHEDFATVRLKS